jgi:hypothetical protein
MEQAHVHAGYRKNVLSPINPHLHQSTPKACVVLTLLHEISQYNFKLIFHTNNLQHSFVYLSMSDFNRETVVGTAIGYGLDEDVLTYLLTYLLTY